MKISSDAQIEGITKTIRKEASKNNPNSDALEQLQLQIRSIKNIAPETPILKRYKTNDSTVEKLGELLRENPTGIMVLRDELVGLIASWEKEGREGERAFYLEGWNGDSSFDTDRIGRGSIFIENLCISLFGGIQPDKLIVYLEQASNALANDGMLQRFQLLVFPDPIEWEWRDRQPNLSARAQVTDLFEKISEFQPCDFGALPATSFCRFPYFSFEDDAQEEFIRWSTNLHTKTLPEEEHPIIAQHLAKYDKLFPALSLIFHILDCVTTGERGPISSKATSMASLWCTFLEAHARRCYGLLIDEGLRAAQALAKKVRTGKLSDGFTSRDIRRPGWRCLTAEQQIEAALTWLCEENWLRVESQASTKSGGRPTTRYFINPQISTKGTRSATDITDKTS